MKKLLALILAAVLVLGVFGCAKTETPPAPTSAGSGTAEPKTPDKTEEPKTASYGFLSIYSAMPESELSTYLAAFEADTGIHVNYIRLSAGEMLTRIMAEQGNPQVSVMHGGPSDTYVSAVKEGVLKKWQPANIGESPKDFCDAEGYWSPIYAGAIAFGCNTDWFEENKIAYPESWADLLKPEFKGEIVMAHPSTSGTAYTVLATMIQLMGEDAAFEYMKQLNVNIRQYTKSGGAAPQQAALGEAAIALTFSHDALVYANQGYPIKLMFPSEGTGYEIGGVAVLEKGIEAEAENAKIFAEWCCSKRAQEIYINNASCRLPVNTTAAVTPGLTLLSDINTIQYDAVWAGEHKKAYVEQFKQIVDNAENLYVAP